MIGFFPDPYPDELLYSACARYAKRTKYLNKRSVLIELFGKRGLSAIVDFPTRLEYFISVLPEGHNYSAEQLINENTILPYHQPFLPIERAKIVRSEMKQEEDNRIHTRLGTRIKQIENPKYLRFCPDCVNEDRQRYGETYWHRIHQLAGILVCPTHQSFLRNSSVELGRVSSSFFHDADIALSAKMPKTTKLNFQNQTHKILYKIACDAEWLLLNGNLQTDSEIIRDRYFNTLLKQGYAYYNGKTKHRKILQDSQKFFPSDLFKIIGRVSDKENWITVLTQIGTINITYHPIRHLLLLTFLGLSAKEFFNNFLEYKPFGTPPYPCLNLASEHYRELRIEKCKILDNISKDTTKQGIPIGIFECVCGFTYQRLGPDKSENDKFSYNLVREYGKVWEAKFKQLWADLPLSLRQIGKQIGISQTSVGRQAIRLNLPMNTDNTRSLHGYNRHRNPNKSFSEIREIYRKDWLKVRQTHPNLTRNQLLNTTNFLFLWLSKNDSEWFSEQLPAPNKIGIKRDRLNWKQIDKDLSKKVEMLRKEILDSKEFPIRICMTEIIKRISHRVWLDKRHKKLPVTSQAIDKSLETLEDFMLRKIEWTKRKFIEEKKTASINQFKLRAILKNSTSDDSDKIQRSIESALIEITNSVDSF